LRDNAIQAAVNVWASEDTAATAVYAQNLPAGQTRRNVLCTIASSWAN
jgi:hypothetical protein